VRAALLTEVGGRPSVAERDDAAAGPGQALVRVLAASLNPIDLSTASGRFYAGPPQVPYVPGREGVGEVLEGRALAPGARVWFLTRAGYGGDGALAELAAVDEETAIALPEGIAAPVAACLGIAAMAAWLALTWRARLEPGETALVLGASGAVGRVAVQGAKLLGAGRVVAAARDADGLERARELGADATVALDGHDGVEALAAAIRDAAGGEVDVIVDPLWGEPALAAIAAAAANARLVQLGQSAGAEASVSSASIRGRQLSILGLTNFVAPREETRRCFGELCAHAIAGDLLIDHELLPLDRIAEAWERQERFPHGKLVITP
jgi:NADPH:quinone reductase-like Zn-dependent oxidoreductase